MGPAEPILAMVGGNTTLHCHLSPERSAEDMEVRWFRWQFSPAVLVYRGRQERTEEQMEAYRGRTSLMSTDISKGRVALILHNITAYDNGIYCCYFQEGRSYDQAIMGLMVASKSLSSSAHFPQGGFGEMSLLDSDSSRTSTFSPGIPFPQGGLLPESA